MKQPMVFENQSEVDSNEFWEDLAKPHDSFQAKLTNMQAVQLLGPASSTVKPAGEGLTTMQKYE